MFGVGTPCNRLRPLISRRDNTAGTRHYQNAATAVRWWAGRVETRQWSDSESKPLLWKRQKKSPGPGGTAALQRPFVATKDICSFSLTTSVPCSIITSDLMISVLIGVQYSGRPFMKHSHRRPPPGTAGSLAGRPPFPSLSLHRGPRLYFFRRAPPGQSRSLCRPHVSRVPSEAAVWHL